MSLQWAAVFGVLCAEILAFLVLLVIPHGPYLARIARSQLFAKVKFGLRILGYILAFFFLDAMRLMYRIEMEKGTLGLTPPPADAYDNFNMRLFRAQRNAYLNFFAVFLLLVLNRFGHSIFELAELKEKCALLEEAAPEQLVEKVDRLVASRYDTTPATDAAAADMMENLSQHKSAASELAEQSQQEQEEQVQSQEETLQPLLDGAKGISAFGTVSDNILPHNRVLPPKEEGLPAEYVNKLKDSPVPAESLVSRLTHRMTGRTE
ncbi:hypothetical protein CAOG_00851 [Capsaspora owczarzaki ATCC 30864]|uniref:Endoplasmic reticulum transmembrane protein n=1 Tax=Capsaspora owczarzaki (strain ATCC 30864) TaxID=595528 RepID=A0A0D2VHC8_CAPO3|nr:hypothetical protein CAOG_00851 [Capsaspora owczarzaki ATCC 30864]KJE89367.1 hypothetical protein CAOG_000851 [Capsaspora owczarzaki ATCC 30864]|eukprot:XP_004365722.1 hypothetical protein CAOG_00851 [Capsaspora owczarzaki ATCC 30864]